MNRALDAAIGGWSASSNVTLQSGLPVAVRMSRNRLADGSLRPNVSCGNVSSGVSYKDAASALLNGASSGTSVFNPTCFSDPADQPLGNTPRYFDNAFSPGIDNVDLGLRKQFTPIERTRLQIRMAAFNAFNVTRFNRAGYRFGGSNFGEVTSLANGFHAGQMQIVARFEF